MRNSLNSCSFIGNLGKDVESVVSKGGHPYAKFTLACNWKTKEKEGTEWINCKAFGRQAEIAEEYLKKGQQVFVEGRMTTEVFEHDGAKRYFTYIAVNRFLMLGQRAEFGPSEKAEPKHDFNDEIPF